MTTPNEIAQYLKRLIQAGTPRESIIATIKALQPSQSTLTQALDLAGVTGEMRASMLNGCGCHAKSGTGDSCSTLGGMSDLRSRPAIDTTCTGPSNNACALGARRLRALHGRISLTAAATTEIKLQPAVAGYIVGFEILSLDTVDLAQVRLHDWTSSDGQQLYDVWGAQANSTLAPKATPVPAELYLAAQGDQTNDFDPMANQHNPMPAPVAGIVVNQGATFVSVFADNADATDAGILTYRVWIEYQ